GCSSGRNWWYTIGTTGTQLSTDGGGTWQLVDMGWSLPDNWFGDQQPNAASAGSSPLNWMNGPTVDWWRAPVPNTQPPAATWMWFDSQTGAPVRMMFGVGPVTPGKGDPAQLAILQMYSFSYFPVFTPGGIAPAPGLPSFDGFALGNPNGFQNFVWNDNFGMTAFMTPVNEHFNPLPTRVLYVWKPDEDYSVYSDRAQTTLMAHTYNQDDIAAEQALLTGPPPASIPAPPNSDTSFIITSYRSHLMPTCVGPPHFDFPQESPEWISIPGVQATIQATITNHPVLCPDEVVTVYSVLFPPSGLNYPDSTYLWVWYAPQEQTGRNSRPVTFMQSQSGVNLGTSLALADYFYYQPFTTAIDPANFAIPAACLTAQPQKPQRAAEALEA
ncbi:MAG: hypothetical protein QOH21_1897, partial [Acidobacteriota bacterium]|nr:hypothetical protein [Acidobacteriota bacterium]